MSDVRPQPLWDSRWRWLAFFLLFGCLGLLWAAQPVLEAEQSSAGGRAQVFYSSHAAWQEAESNQIPLLAGTRMVRLKLPLFLPKTLRYDPVDQPGDFHLHRVSLRYLLFSIEVAPASLEPLVASVGVGQSTPGGDVEYVARDADPQLALRVPRLAALWFSIPLLATLLALWLVWAACWPRLRAHGRTLAISILFLASCYAILVYQAIALGPWLPILDDWRYLFPGAFSLVDGNTHWLTIAGNDTYFLTGQLLDWVLLTLTSASFLVVRVFALALLGAFLAFATRLAVQLCGDSAALAVAALSFTVTAVAYWNLQAVAYHQFLPVLLLFVAVALMHGYKLRRRMPRSLVWGLVLSTAFAGLAYISGAVLLLAFAIGYLIGERPGLDRERWRAQSAPLIIGAVALATLLIQLTLVSQHQGSLLEHNHATATVYPDDPRFWAFQIGLVARALGATGRFIWLDVALYVLVIAAAATLLWRSRQALAEQERFSVSVCLGFFSAAFIYTCVVASGRAGFAPAEAPWLHAVAVSKARFHFWWITALLAIPLATVAQHVMAGRSWLRAFVRGGVGALMIAKLLTIHSIDIPAYRDAKLRESGAVECVRDSVRGKDVFATAVRCDGFYPADLRAPLQIAREKNLMAWRRIMQEP